MWNEHTDFCSFQDIPMWVWGIIQCSLKWSSIDLIHHYETKSFNSESHQKDILQLMKSIKSSLACKSELLYLNEVQTSDTHLNEQFPAAMS